LQRISADVRARLFENKVTTVETLHELNGTPHASILEKHTSYLTPLLAQFIEMSPLFFLGTANADGSLDVSPRGDPPGSVKILDSRTIFFADRAGNRRLDSFRNIVSQPNVGLCFVVPPVEIDEVYGHCSRAFLRGKLWKPDTWTDPDLVPTLHAIMCEQKDMPLPDESSGKRQEEYRKNLG
jgi:predicted pyridoxine 5'-phosphate oxidase superfamily flavin-nucleotide-binding protein